MQVFDASSMIYAWDNYPVHQFPGLWEWMASQIEAKYLTMSSVAFDEVVNKTPECGEWLRDYAVEQFEISNIILQDALRIKDLLGIFGDKYHAKGVGENDLLIIATARANGAELVSNESKQKLPDIPAKRKIPSVCAMNEVRVPCLDFIEYIKRSGVIFR
jgi:predicted nucleic acid-binding protein